MVVVGNEPSEEGGGNPTPCHRCVYAMDGVVMVRLLILLISSPYFIFRIAVFFSTRGFTGCMYHGKGKGAAMHVVASEATRFSQCYQRDFVGTGKCQTLNKTVSWNWHHLIVDPVLSVVASAEAFYKVLSAERLYCFPESYHYSIVTRGAVRSPRLAIPRSASRPSHAPFSLQVYSCSEPWFTDTTPHLRSHYC